VGQALQLPLPEPVERSAGDGNDGENKSMVRQLHKGKVAEEPNIPILALDKPIDTSALAVLIQNTPAALELAVKCRVIEVTHQRREKATKEGVDMEEKRVAADDAKDK
jgi:hypothetical protein